MAQVQAEVEHTEGPNEKGRIVPMVVVTCLECQHQTKSFGHGEGSVKRCLFLLREECPRDEVNFYVVDE